MTANFNKDIANINTDDLPALPEQSNISGMIIAAAVLGIIGLVLLML
ncbi:hypothetical protein IJT93_06950 [bacterium]|nr:hypothetical protein [bacterium]